MFAYDKIKEVQLEITNRCQAACPMCVRNIHGGIDNDRIVESDLSLDNFKRIFTREFLLQLTSLNFCGNYGENIVNNDFVSMCEYVKEVNPDIRILIHTNGSARTTKWWTNLASVLPKNHSVNFAIDGLEDTHHLYRINTDFNKIIENAQAFIQAGGNATWMFIRFKHNQHQEDEALKLSQKLGFKTFLAKNSRRFANQYPVLGRSGEVAYHIEQPTYSTVQPVTFRDLKDYKSWTGLEYKCYAEKDSSIFIDTFGHVYPCCIMSGFMYLNYEVNIYKKYNIYDPDDVNLIAEEIKQNVEDFVEELGGLESINSITHGVKGVANSKGWLSVLKARQDKNQAGPCTIMCSNKSPYMLIEKQFVNRA